MLFVDEIESVDLDTMYEYWILFELIAYLQNEKNIICKIHSENNIEIRNGNKKILCFQSKN